MKKFQKVTYVVLGMIIMALMSVSIIPSMAALVEKQIKVLTGVNIYIDDTKLNPADPNGKPVEVFIYNGTTYLPARAVSEALGKTVLWEGKTSSVFIGKHSSETPVANLINMDTFYSNAIYYYDNIEAAGEKDNIGSIHKNGLILSARDFSNYNVYLLNQKFSNFKGKIAVSYDGKDDSDKAWVRIYGDDKLLYESPEMSRGVYPVDFDVDVSGVIQLKIDWYSNESQNVIFSGLDFYNY